MSSERYSESRTIREETRRGTDPYDSPYSQRVSVPIQQSSNSFGSSTNEERVRDRIRSQDTRLQWVTDPVSGQEKFRININIDGFHQNEVNIRVDGNKLIVYGEHLESQNQGSAKKIIEKSYELPHGIDTFSPRVTFPTSTTMQVDFPSRHSNVIIDNGRTSTGQISHYDTGRRTPPRLTQERSSTEYTSTRKIAGDNSYLRSSSPRTYTSYEDSYGGNYPGRNSSYSSTSHYQTVGNSSPYHRDYTSSSTSYNNSANPTYTYSATSSDSPSRTSYPSTQRNVEVREYSRRIGNTGNNDSSLITREPSLFSQNFNSDAFYRSAFQPQIVNDDHGQKRIDMKLAVGNYQPNEIKVSVDGNDLIVQAEHNDERPPSSATRAYFYKQITLPSNTDFNSLTSQYHPDGRLHITAKFNPEQASIRYN